MTRTIRLHTAQIHRIGVLWVILAVFAAAGCEGSSQRPDENGNSLSGAVPETAEQPDERLEVPESSAAAADEGVTPTSSLVADAEGATLDGHGSAAAVSTESVTDTAAPLVVDIYDVMATAQFNRESEQDLADYLPVPPRSEGQVGRFVRDGTVVSVARVTYPSPLFASPHESWVQERMRLIPDSHERVIRIDATVVHVVAESNAVADEVALLFQRAMIGAEGNGAERDDPPNLSRPTDLTEDGS